MTNEAGAIEAVLMVAQEPVDPHLLAQLLEVPQARVEELCEELRSSYEEAGRGFVLTKVAGGYRFQSHADYAGYVERFVLEGQTARLSSAALETLAIVAYKQPLSRAQVAAIRGVNVDGVMRTLQQRGYVAEVGRDSGPGQATLFGTTPEFLERMGLASLDDLPPIHDLFPSAEVMEALEKTLRAEPAESGPSDGEAADEADGSPGGEGAIADDGPGEAGGGGGRVEMPFAGSAAPDATDGPVDGPAHDQPGSESSIDLDAAVADTASDDRAPRPGSVFDDDEPPAPEPPAWAIDLTDEADPPADA